MAIHSKILEEGYIMAKAVLECKDVFKQYELHSGPLEVLKGVSFELKDKELYQIFYNPKTSWSESGFYSHFVAQADEVSTPLVSTLLKMVKVIDQWNIKSFSKVLTDDMYDTFKYTKDINGELENFKKGLINSFIESYVKKRFRNTPDNLNREEQHSRQITFYLKLFKEFNVKSFTKLHLM